MVYIVIVNVTHMDPAHHGPFDTLEEANNYVNYILNRQVVFDSYEIVHLTKLKEVSA